MTQAISISFLVREMQFDSRLRWPRRLSACVIHINAKKKIKKTVDLHSRPRHDRRTTLTVTHGFVNTVYNRKRQGSAISHKIVVNLAVFS